jgi:Putative MetA-pathway of phenol degradation
MNLSIALRVTIGALLPLGLVAGAVGYAPTQGETVQAQAPSQTHAQTTTIQDLVHMLEQRDAVIRQLVQRMEALEEQVRAKNAIALAPTAAAPVEPPPLPASKPALAAPQYAAAELGEGASETEGQAARSPGQAPGEIYVDEDSIERALERTLVEEGALLLPFGKAEIQPSMTFERSDSSFPIVAMQNGNTLIGDQEIRRNELTPALDLRVGLPLDAQLELGLPYQWVQQSAVASVGGRPLNEDDATGHGFGDLSVGLAKTLLREQGYVPDVVARVRWDSATGKKEDNGVGLGGGFNELTGQLVASKRQDPLVFVGSLSYETTFEDDGLDPGDEFGFTLGTVLAASPETSLRFLLDQRFADDFEVDGQPVRGSDQVMSTLSIGAASILGRGVLLDLAAGVGLTDDAPDYSVSVSLPIRFDLPIIE